MGADFLLASLPAVRMTAERQDQFHRLVNSLTDADLDEELLGLPCEESSDVRQALHVHVDLLIRTEYRRDVAIVHLPDMPYAVAFTGGMSWGDDPTEIFETFCVLARCEPLYRQLEAWTREDTARRTS